VQFEGKRDFVEWALLVALFLIIIIGGVAIGYGL